LHVSVAGAARIRGKGWTEVELLRTLDLYAPSDAFSILPVEIFTFQDISFLVHEALDIRKDLPLEGVGDDIVWHVRVDRDRHELILRWPGYGTQAGH